MKYKCPSRVVKTRPLDILFVAQNMRPDEIEQLIAIRDVEGYDPDETAVWFMNKLGPKFTLLDKNGLPICVGGYEPVLPGVWQSWMLGTMEAWETDWRSITKACRWLAEELFLAGARRLQCNALASRTAACEWYVRSLKMTPEGVWRKFGLQGQDIACFSRLAED